MMTLTEQNYYDDSTHISASMLRDFDTCPFYYYIKHVTKEWKDEEKEPDYFIYGRALDTLLTEGEKEFGKKFTVVPRRTGKSPLVELTPMMYEGVAKSQNELLRQPLFQELMGLDGWEKQKILQAELKDEFTGEVTPVKGKLDFFNKKHGIIIDLKSTANLDRFYPAVDYAPQMGWYHDLAKMAADTACKIYLIAVDKTCMYRSRLYIMSDETVYQGKRKAREILERLKLSLSTGMWVPLDYDDQKPHECPAYSLCPLAIQKRIFII